MVKTRFFKFNTGDGAVRRTGAIVEYLDQSGNWIVNGGLIRMFVGGDTDFYEITEEANKLVEKRKRRGQQKKLGDN